VASKVLESKQLLSATFGDGTNDPATVQLDPPSIPVPLLVINDVTIDEGGIATLTVSATRPLSGTTKVDWATEDITASDGLDYVGASGTIELGPNTQSTTIAIQTLSDSLAEGDEFFRVVLSGAIGVFLVDPKGVVTIRENTGQVSGNVWDDLNGNGIRDTLITGDEPIVVFVIDVSTSTRDPFTGSERVGDVNNDGLENTILDVQLQAFIDLNGELIRSGFGDVAHVSIVAFSGNARIVLPLTSPNTDGNSASDVEDALRTLRFGGATNYFAALDVTRQVLDNSQADVEDQNVIFLSDGEPNDDNFAAIAQQLRNTGANVRAFGTSNGGDSAAQLAALQQIDVAACIFESADELRDVFGNLDQPGSLNEPGLAGVLVYADLNGNGTYDAPEDANGNGILDAAEDLNGNGSLDAGEPFTISMTDDPMTHVDETGNYVLTGLPTGLVDIRQVVPPGRTQTFPGGGGAHTVTVTPGATVSRVNFGSIADERSFFVTLGTDDPDVILVAVAHEIRVPAGGQVTFSVDGRDLVATHNGRELSRLHLPPLARVNIFGPDTDDDVVIRPNDTGERVKFRFNAGGGDDTVSVEGGALLRPYDLYVAGGAGNDRIDLSPATSDRAYVSGGDGDDTLIGSEGHDLLSGDGGTDSILAGGGNDIVSGDSGASKFTGVGGNDFLDGGAGIDTVYEWGNVDFVVTNDRLTGHGVDQLSAIESVWIIGAAGANRLDASGFVSPTGRVQFYGRGGDDTLIGSAGNDVLDGGDGNDRLYGRGGADTLSGSGGDDVLRAGAGNDLASGGTGNDLILGGRGHDSLAGGDGNDIILGQSGNDSLQGDDGNDRIGGQNGDDVLFGGNGNDLLDGGSGSDTIHGEAGHDRILGRDGADLLYGGGDNDTVYGGRQNDSISGGGGHDILAGQDGDDVITGNEGNDTLVGNAGADLLFGYAGNDFLWDRGAPGDTLIGGEGDDTLRGDTGDTIISGLPRKLDETFTRFDLWAASV